MKRKLSIFLSAVFAAITFAGCNNKPQAEETPASVSANSPLSFVYENAIQTNWASSLFSPDENGLLYVTDPADTEGTNVIIKTYNIDGSPQKEYTVSFENVENPPVDYINITFMEIWNGKIYLYLAERIYAYDIAAGSLTEIVNAENILTGAQKMTVSAEGIYLLGAPIEGSERINKSFTLENDTNIFLSYDTKALYRISFEGEAKRIDEEYTIAFDTDEKGEAVIFAFDTKKGYYFARPESDGERLYADFGGLLGSVSDMDISPAGAVLSGIRNGKLCVADISAADISGEKDKPIGTSDFLENVYSYLPNDVKCAGDYIFYRTGDTVYDSVQKIYRLDSKEALSKGSLVIQTSMYLQIPFSEGYEINLRQITEEMFALQTISGSSSFDVSCFVTNAPYAKNMQSSSAFCPLNEIPAVTEYLDNCHPYIKAACTNKNGNIWALPICLDVPVIVYNKDNCEKAGLSFSSDLDEFVNTVHTASQMGCRYDCIRYSFKDRMLLQYLSDHESFDTEEFRHLAVTLKEKCSDDVFLYDSMIYSDLMDYNVSKKLGLMEYTDHRSYDEIFFTLMTDSSMQTDYLADDDNLSAAPLPRLGKGKNAAVCTFMCVNSGGENRETALMYISALAKKLSENPGNIMLTNGGANSEYIRTLRDIYADSDICFAVPYSVYWDDLDEYLKGSMTLDEFIQSADSKMKLYQGERE
ncbi:MAG: hypothetical protein K2K57_10120 [Oscillospiraceae bacterium]|nr:hypothetical protein [Oscillospiraceae bacterium]